MLKLSIAFNFFSNADAQEPGLSVSLELGGGSKGKRRQAPSRTLPPPAFIPAGMNSGTEEAFC